MAFHNTTLSNGLRIIAECTPTAHSVATGFFVKTGSRDEDAALAGVSHFLEHMVFKGTERRDALQVNRDFDRVGAEHNAQTSEEDTIYHACCLPEYHPNAFAVLADILRPSLRDEDFETEKQVIIEEIRMYLDNPMMVALDEARATHFGTHPLGQSILGTVDSIQALSVDQMRDYFARRYGPANIVVAVAGKIRWEDVVALAETHCGGWTGPQAARTVAAARGTHGFKTILRADDNQQTIIAVADAPGVESPDRYAAGLLSTILGDHTGSRLYWELVDPGHADGAALWYQDYNDSGAYYTFLSCDPSDAQENLDRVAGVYRRVMGQGITEEELTQAQNKVQSRVVLSGERPMGRLLNLGSQWAYRHEYLTVEQELENFAKVTTADLRRVLEQWPLVPLTVVSVGPTTDLSPPG